MKCCANSRCPGRSQNNQPPTYPDTVDACPHCGVRLVAQDRAGSDMRPSVSKTVFVTLGAVGIYFIGRQISLPGVKLQAEFRDATTMGSILALGVWPLLSAYVLVEFAALLVPSWRPLRVGGPAGRAKLRRAAWMIGMFLTLFQANVLTAALQPTGGTGAVGVGYRLMTILTLMGATAALLFLARTVDRAGLGSGLVVLLLAEFVLQLLGPFQSAYSDASSGAIPYTVFFVQIFVTAVLVAIALWMFSPFSLPIGQGWPHPSVVGRPACGVIPITFVGGILMFVSGLSRLTHPNQTSASISPGALPMAVLLSVFAAVAFALLFNHPRRIAATWKRLAPNPPEGIPSLKPVLFESVLFIVLVVLINAWAVNRVGMYAPDVVKVLLLTAIVCDLARELGAKRSNAHLVSAWEIHQMFAVVPAIRMLEAEGIRAFAKGTRLRTLLQFFGPYAPVQILVAAQDAPRAQALLQARWPSDGAST